MAITIVKKNDQVAGGFDSGRIEENKPIGFPQEGGKLTSFSNLFYWSHAWSVPGGLIGEHPHKGFEIISYVLKGNLEHFDNGQNSWVPLEEGDLQIIRAGNGIRHAERFLKDSAIFQIWLDPDLSKTLQKPASYNDYRHDDFPVSIGQGIKEKILIGPSSPVTLDTPGILMKDMTLAYKVHGLQLKKDTINTFFILEGELEIDGSTVTPGDVFKVTGIESLAVKTNEESRVFMTQVPESPGYQTYANTQA